MAAITNRPRCKPLALALIILIVLAGCAARTQAAGKPAVPPLPVIGPLVTVFNGDLGDPFVLKTSRDPTYVVFGTDDPPYRIPTATSADLAHWRQGPDALPQLPRWAAPDPNYAHSWAPALLTVGDSFVMYVTVPDAASGRPCVEVATARRPVGPYSDALGHPLVCQPALGGSIDPSVIRSPTGTVTLLWKTNGVCCTDPSALWAQQLRPDGLGLAGAPHRLLNADRDWQRGVVEEPAAVPASKGGWWLFYSGDSYDQPGYSIGLAWCPSLQQPCLETSDRPLLSTVGRLRSPGGLETFRQRDGTLTAVVDTWNRPPRAGRYRCCRSLDIAELHNL